MVVAVLVLAFAFQGSRGIWEPDEGYYVNPAHAMLESGHWLVPRLNGGPFLDKPPLVFWSTAAGMGLLGANEWGARVGQALWFAATALLVGLLAGRWWGPRTGKVAALVYASSLGPFLAANALTPDTPLAFCVTLAYYAFWRLEEEGPHRRIGWGALLGVALGLGILAKGPALLVATAPLGVYLALRRRLASLLTPPYLLGGVLFAALAVPWYAAVISTIPGAGAYILDNQVTGRLFTGHLERNPGWAGGFAVYLPTLLVAGLPWNVIWLRDLVRGRWRRAQFRSVAARWRERPERLLLALWVAVPLAVFCAAQSRLPLYVLPLFAPLTMVTAHRLTEASRALPASAGRWVPRLVVAWLLLLVAVKVAVARVPSHQDSRAVARELQDLGLEPDRLVIALDTKKNGLSLYGWKAIEMVSAGRSPYPLFTPIESLAEELTELDTEPGRRLFLVGTGNAGHLEQALERAGVPHESHRLTLPYVAILTE